MKKLLMLVAFVVTAEQRMSLHWLVREDIFAGILANDRERLDKGEKTLNSVAAFYEEVNVMAWRASIESMRAIWAHEEGKPQEFRRHFSLAMTYFDRCRTLATGRNVVIPEIFEGAIYALLSDRLPTELRAGGWERGYQAYKKLNALEVPRIDQLPVHMKGEILSGLVLTAQKTGRQTELAEALAVLQQKMPGTVYGNAAKKWSEDPASVGKSRMICLSCHEPNTLGPKIHELHKTN